MESRELTVTLIVSNLIFIFMLMLSMHYTTTVETTVRDLKEKNNYNLLVTHIDNIVKVTKCDVKGLIREEDVYTLDKNNAIVSYDRHIHYFSRIDAFRERKTFIEEYGRKNIKLSENIVILKLPSPYHNLKEIEQYVDDYKQNTKSRVIIKSI